jgi:hypothetical protein
MRRRGVSPRPGLGRAQFLDSELIMAFKRSSGRDLTKLRRRSNGGRGVSYVETHMKENRAHAGRTPIARPFSFMAAGQRFGASLAWRGAAGVGGADAAAEGLA